MMAPIIRHFLDGIDSGKHEHVPGLGISTQNLENPLLRRQVGLREDQSGVLLITLEHDGSAWGVLRPGDVLLAVDGHDIANNGTVRFRDRYRTRYDVVLGSHYVGDEIGLEILRDGQRREVRVQLKKLERLVPRCQYDTEPTYFVYGGLVFQALTRDFLTTWDKWWNKAPKEFLHYYYSGVRTASRHEVVVLSQILADEINIGYEHLYNEGVALVDGHEPKSMADFVARVEASDGVVEIRTTSDGVAMFEAAEARAASERILARYHIPRDRSADLASSG